MEEETENTVDNGPAEPEESGTAVKDELIAVFKNTLDISQDSESPESASSEKTQSWEKRDGEGEGDGEGDGQQDGQKDGQHDEQKDGQQDEQKDGQQNGQKDGQHDEQKDGQQDEQKDGQQDEQKDGQQDGQTVPPPAAEPGTESKWAVGAQCRAVWSEDGRLYPATVLCLDGERCRVRFNGYGNQQDVDLSDLKSPDAAPQTQRPNSQDWKPGARCRAVYVEDGLVYPAVVLWVKGQRCGVRFDDYNNEEEVDAGSLMNPDELHGPSRATKGSNWQFIVTNGKVDWKMRKKGERGGEGRREESQGERGGEGRREESQGERGGETRREESQGERGGEGRREESQGERGGEREESQGERGGEGRREESQGERGGEGRREESQGERGGEGRREESQGERGGEGRREESQGERGGEGKREENTSQVRLHSHSLRQLSDSPLKTQVLSFILNGGSVFRLRRGFPQGGHGEKFKTDSTFVETPPCVALWWPVM
uniref:Tudor domain-containing protein n=1 Tax=Sander lucioperca TaxID=283035 RepID=A0A8C9ZP80_SANLU